MTQPSQTQNPIIALLSSTALALLTLTTAAPANAADFYQNSLFSPSQGLLRAEARGRVMIYDGMHSDTIEVAMTEQFDRIESMMFVNTRHSQPDGEVVEDDDC